LFDVIFRMMWMILGTGILTQENDTQSTCTILLNVELVEQPNISDPIWNKVVLFDGCYGISYKPRIICLDDEFFLVTIICALGCRLEENVNHSFMVCDHFGSIWSLVFR
jgi:hypothetical protein